MVIKVPVQVRMSVKLKKALKKEANSMGRSLNLHINHILCDHDVNDLNEDALSYLRFFRKYVERTELLDSQTTKSVNTIHQKITETLRLVKNQK